MSQTIINNCPSICIPRVFSNITETRIRDVFTELFGNDAVDRIDMVARASNDGTKYWRVFIHFNAYPGEVGATVRERLDAGETVKIVYDEPWYWKCSKSRVDKPKGGRREHQAPYIETQPMTKNEDTDMAEEPNARSASRSAVSPTRRRRLTRVDAVSPSLPSSGTKHNAIDLSEEGPDDRSR